MINLDKDLYKTLIVFLSVVYTIGNVTPAVCNKRANSLDSWEYKLDRDVINKKEIDLNKEYNINFEKYSELYYFQDYYYIFLEHKNHLEKSQTEWNRWHSKPNEHSLKEYMHSRIFLILKRGWRIVLSQNNIKYGDTYIDYLAKTTFDRIQEQVNSTISSA